jgi:hypothetical protein
VDCCLQARFLPLLYDFVMFLLQCGLLQEGVMRGHEGVRRGSGEGQKRVREGSPTRAQSDGDLLSVKPMMCESLVEYKHYPRCGSQTCV